MKKNDVTMNAATATAEKAKAKKTTPETVTTESTTGTNYQALYKNCPYVYTDKKNAARIGAIIENCRRAENGYKFKTLTGKDNFTDDKKQYTEYREAADLYMSMLYLSKSTVSKDKALRNVLCALSANKDQITKLVKKDLHDTLIKNTLKNRQNMTEEGAKERAKILAAREEIEEKGIMTDPETGKITVLTPEAKEEKLATLKKQLEDLYASKVFEKAELCQVALGTFIKSMEMLIGNVLVDNDIVQEYLTLADKKLNQKWTKLNKKSIAAGIDAETFAEYHAKRDSDGLKKLIAEKNAEKLEKEAAEKPAELAEPETATTTEPAEK